MSAARHGALRALAAVFAEHGEAECLAAMQEAIECMSSAAGDVVQERNVVQAAQHISHAAWLLTRAREFNPDLPQLGDAFEVALEIAEEVEHG